VETVFVIFFFLGMIVFLVYQLFIYKRRSTAQTLEKPFEISDKKQRYVYPIDFGPIDLSLFNNILAQLDLHIINNGYEPVSRSDVSLFYKKGSERSELAYILLLFSNLLSALVYRHVNKDEGMLLVRLFIRPHDVGIEINATGEILSELILIIDKATMLENRVEAGSRI
jgi:hypothetical protein